MHYSVIFLLCTPAAGVLYYSMSYKRYLYSSAVGVLIYIYIYLTLQVYYYYNHCHVCTILHLRCRCIILILHYKCNIIVIDMCALFVQLPCRCLISSMLQVQYLDNILFILLTHLCYGCLPLVYNATAVGLYFIVSRPLAFSL